MEFKKQSTTESGKYRFEIQKLEVYMFPISTWDKISQDEDMMSFSYYRFTIRAKGFINKRKIYKFYDTFGCTYFTATVWEDGQMEYSGISLDELQKFTSKFEKSKKYFDTLYADIYGYGESKYELVEKVSNN